MPRRRSQFRPCIDLHDGRVKQIVGGTLRTDSVEENFVSELPPAHYAKLFHDANLIGGHVIKLGPGNEAAAKEALSTWSRGLQIGGGVNGDNANEWIDAGASHVIVTSWLFDGDGKFLPERAAALRDSIGRNRVVIDLSCRRTETGWQVAQNRWQTLTDLSVSVAALERLSQYCDEFLIHAADVEGKSAGIDGKLVELLAGFSDVPVTYAGGVANMDDVRQIDELSDGKIDVTVGSALDIFGGSGLTLAELIAWNSGQ